MRNTSVSITVPERIIRRASKAPTPFLIEGAEVGIVLRFQPFFPGKEAVSRSTWTMVLPTAFDGGDILWEIATGRSPYLIVVLDPHCADVRCIGLEPYAAPFDEGLAGCEWRHCVYTHHGRANIEHHVRKQQHDDHAVRLHSRQCALAPLPQPVTVVVNYTLLNDVVGILVKQPIAFVIALVCDGGAPVQHMQEFMIELGVVVYEELQFVLMIARW